MVLKLFTVPRKVDSRCLGKQGKWTLGFGVPSKLDIRCLWHRAWLTLGVWDSDDGAP